MLAWLLASGCAPDMDGALVRAEDVSEPAPPSPFSVVPTSMQPTPTSTTPSSAALVIGRPALAVDPLIPGAYVALVAEGAAPGAEVTFVAGRLSGTPTCPAFLNGTCLNLREPKRLGRGIADAAGVATITVLLDAAAPEDQWFVFQGAEAGTTYTTPIVLRRTDTERLPTLDYKDPFEPNTREPAMIVPGSYYGLTIKVSDKFEDQWADWYAIETPPNRTVVWKLAFVDGSVYWYVVSGGPDESWGEVVTDTNTEFELHTSAGIGGLHQLLIESGEYAMPHSVYQMTVEVIENPAIPWWPDSDGDAHGDIAAAPIVAVDPPADGWVPDGTDCDDADSSVYPGAPEICGDGIAQACTVDRPCSPPASGTVALSDVGTVIAGDRYSFGRAILAGGDLNGDGVDELIVGDQPAVRVFTGPLVGDAASSTASGAVFGDLDDFVQDAAVVVGDVNGDGIGDLAVGGSRVDGGREHGRGGHRLRTGRRHPRHLRLAHPVPWVRGRRIRRDHGGRARRRRR